MSSPERFLYADPVRRNQIFRDLVCRIDSLAGGTFDLVVSVDTESLFLGSLLAEALKLPMAYVRPRPKGHGRQKQVEGKIGVGDRVLLVADTAAATEPVARSVEVVEALGGRVSACLAVLAADTADLAEFFGRRPDIALESVTTLARQPWPGLKEKVALALLEVGAVAINRRKPFTYASGIVSPIYTDCRLLITNPERWSVVIDAFVELATELGLIGKFDVLAGTATAGVPHAALLAGRLGVPMAYLTFPDGDQPVAQVEGRIDQGDRVVMIEDLVTTGKSVLKSVAAIQELGATVEGCLAIFSYGSPAAVANFQEKRLNWTTLCDIQTLLTVAREHGRIDDVDEAAVLDWLEAPTTWAERQKRLAEG